jgi:TRAP-type C4-dicarboxylate transport system substrate-binding protein
VEKSYKETEKLIAGKGEIITLSEEELNKFKSFAKARWDEWIKDADERGYDGEKLMNEFKELLESEGLPLPY